ncbi:DNA (cytosine-5-)-methyltransferase [Brevundimonas naejangsanensis]|uniref:DNA (cytosine-5-)-methyltransferase n=1 Tax=Brevundimonas naejangsanensis TaxID=588932 RepID=A0A172Y487_9CAUL|nr:DNA cytosine methyltransferase [Brevundimonas naejangsanensis]ANF54039.1 DNA (cytosine-5-)-methyltransferase [Brevundimonas naejangsanensis]
MTRKFGIPTVDLFAGAGGLSVGATSAGCDVRAAFELDLKACETMRLNDGYHGQVLQADVAKLTGDDLRQAAKLKAKDPLIVVGGAPCQPFSKAAYWVEDGEESRYRRARAAGESVLRPAAPTEARPDERRTLVEEFWRLIFESNADGFVFENVPSIRHPRNRPVLEGFRAAAEAAGYEVTETLGNAAHFGVAQTRERVFLLGSRKRKPVAPSATHAMTSDRATGLKAPATAGAALEGLDGADYFEPEEVVTGRWAEHLKTVPPGSNYKAHTAWAGHPHPSFVTETRFWNFLLKLAPERPSWTIAASPGPWTGPFHWDTRRLRTVEMAALQGFPRGYQFAGSRRDRVRQIGNAVPPPMAAAMVRAVAEAVT